MKSIFAITKQFTFVLITLTFAFALALAANVVHGQWTNPTSAPTGNNAAAPINVGGAQQYKQGNLRADEFHSDRYCDSAGNGCVAHNQIGGTPTLQMGTAIQTSSHTTENIWVPFPTPFASVPQVHASLMRVSYRNNCRSDSFTFSAIPHGITQFGFFMTLSGGNTCGGRQDVAEASWIAVQ